MQWILASDQFPEKDKPESLKGKIMRNIRTKIVIPDYEVHGYLAGMLLIEGRNDDIEILYIDIEWLDESIPASAEDEAARMYPDTTSEMQVNYLTEDVMILCRKAHIRCAGMYTGEIETLKAENSKMRAALEEAKRYMESVDKFMIPKEEGYFETCANDAMNAAHIIDEALQPHSI